MVSNPEASLNLDKFKTVIRITPSYKISFELSSFETFLHFLSN